MLEQPVRSSQKQTFDQDPHTNNAHHEPQKDQGPYAHPVY